MKNKIFAVVLAVLFIVSVLSVTAFADDTETGDEPVTITSEGSEGSEGEGDDIATPPAETGEEKTGEETGSNEEVTTTGETKETTTTTKEKNWFEKNQSLVIALAIVLGIVVIFFIVFAVSPKFREKVKKFWKDYNAEFKKLVWPTKQQLIRNSSVVLITIVVAGALLALLDLGLSKGFKELKDLIEYIWPAP